MREYGKDKQLALRLQKEVEVEEATAAAAGKKEFVSLSLFMEVDNLECEADLSTVATLFWAEGVWWRRWKKSTRRRGESRSLKYSQGDR